MSTHEKASTVCPRDRDHWREWLLAHHAEHENVWLVYHKKSSPTPNLTWSEAVDEALCFGWIDSRAAAHRRGPLPAVLQPPETEERLVGGQ